MIPPLVIASGVGLILLWIHQLMAKVAPSGNIVILQWVLVSIASVSGAVLISLSIADTIGTDVFSSFPEGRGLSLSVGVLLLAYAARLIRILAQQGRSNNRSAKVAGPLVVEWGAVFVLVSVGLFWAVGSYAIGVGEGRGRELEHALPSLPNVTLFSEKNLNLNGPGVEMLACQDLESAYRFRYDGLKMVMQSGDQYLLLPSQWTRESAAAILVPRTDTIRLEFGVGQQRPPAC
jgi:hypothetical protein